jgi:sensor histidine kinase YesM
MAVLRKKIYWILQFGGWGFYLVVMLFFLSLGGFLELNQFISFFLLAAFYLVSTHLLRAYILRRKWLDRALATFFAPLSAVIVILTLLNYTFQVAVSFGLGITDLDRDFQPFYIITNLVGVLSLYYLWVLIYFMYHYIDSYNNALKYQARINEIELNQLKAQLNPHFIFNALNSIRALVDEDPVKSKNAITQLSNILRNSLVVDKKRLTNFAEELQTVRDYLELETIRYEERLHVEFEVDPSCFNHEVPPMMLQTLVENGIKHGISTLKAGGLLKIWANVSDGEMIIRIYNSGKYVNGKAQNNKGVGLENTSQRLKLIYGDRAKFNIKNVENNLVRTELRIPNVY